MRTRFKRKMIVIRACLHILGVGFLGYFSYHTVTGSFGLRSSKVMEDRISVLKEKEASLSHRRTYLQKQVALMSDGTMEADMLDERARKLLSVSRSDEIVIFYK